MGTIVNRVAIRRYAMAAVVCLVVAAQYASAQTAIPLTIVGQPQRFQDSAGNIVIIGEVRNDTAETLSIPKAVVTLTGAQTTTHNVEVWTSSARKLSGIIFAFALAPQQTGFFRFSTGVQNSAVASYTVTAEAQRLFTALPMRTSLDVSVTFSGSNYSLRITNQSDTAIAHNIQSGVSGKLNGAINDVDLASVGGSVCSPATMVLPNGGSQVTISGTFERPVTDMTAQGIALKWDEIYVEPSAFSAPAAGGIGDIRVASQCAWTAQSNASWISIVSGTSGTGDGIVRISAPANPTTAVRSGTLTIAGLTVRVEQAAGTGTSFTDPQLTSGVTPVRTQHITELRTRIQALRSRFNLAAYPFTDTTLSARVSPIRAVHITQLRLALDEVYAAAKRTPPTYTDSPLTAGMTIKASHISELRAAVLAIE
jgi:hypothetical protein